MPSIKLFDGDTGIVYILEVSQEDAIKASEDILFATQLLRDYQGNAQNQPITESESSLNDVCYVSEETAQELSDYSQEKDNFRWPHEAILLLLTVYTEQEHLIVSEKISVKKFWTLIASQLIEKGYKVTSSQCKNKIMGLKNTYKSVRDHNAKNGNSNRTWRYYDIMNKILKKEPWTTPAFRLDNNPTSSSSELEHSTNNKTSSSCKTELSSKHSKQFTTLEKIVAVTEEGAAERRKMHEEAMARQDKLLDILGKILNNSSSMVEVGEVVQLKHNKSLRFEGVKHEKQTPTVKSKKKDCSKTMLNIKLLDADTGIVHTLDVSEEDAKRANEDSLFATQLLHNYQRNMQQNHAQPVAESESLSSSNDVCHVSEETVQELSCSQEKDSFRWPHEAILLLLTVCTEQEHLVASGKITMKKFWTLVASQLIEKGYNVTSSQCKSKMAGLKNTYRSVKDYNARNNRNNRTWRYFDIMDKVLKKRPWMTSVFTLDSNSISLSEPEHSTNKRSSSPSELSSKHLKRLTTLEKVIAVTEESTAERKKMHEEAMARQDKLLDVLEKILDK